MFHVTWRSDQNSIQNSYALNTLTNQADCAWWRHHNLDKSSLSISLLWLLNVHPLANVFWKYGERSIWFGFSRPFNVWLWICQLLSNFGSLEILNRPWCRIKSCIKGKNCFRQSKMNWILSEAIMNYRYHRRLKVTYVRKFKWVNKWGQYLEQINCTKVHYIVKWCNMGLNWAHSIHLNPITILKIFILNKSFSGKNRTLIQSSNYEWDIL